MEVQPLSVGLGFNPWNPSFFSMDGVLFNEFTYLNACSWVVVLSGEVREPMGAMALLEDVHRWSEALSSSAVVCSPSLLPVDGDVTTQLSDLGTCYGAISCQYDLSPWKHKLR